MPTASRTAFIEQYADMAMEQMRQYGVPASVTLAQACIESRDGQSMLFTQTNNAFGIKGTYNGSYSMHTDDDMDRQGHPIASKFRAYPDLATSFEDHSKVVTGYATTAGLAADDYEGWAHAIAAGGYASNPHYESDLLATIRANNLDRYDQMVMAEAAQQAQPLTPAQPSSPSMQVEPNGLYSFPIQKDFLLITSPFGPRTAPTSGASTNHGGIDIRSDNDPVLATENDGTVVQVGYGEKEGNFVTVEYEHDDGDKVQCTYMHLNAIDVKKGDVVNAGDRLGMSGATGNVTGPHLHFSVKTQADGAADWRALDPAIYLAEIGQKGNIDTQALYNGKDLLADYRKAFPAATPALAQAVSEQEHELSPEEWMKKLLSSEDSGLGDNTSLTDFIMQLFAILFFLAHQYDEELSRDKQKAAITDMVVNKTVDLTPLVPDMRSCTLSLTDGKALLSADNGVSQVSKELTATELTRLNDLLTSDTLDDAAKAQRVAGMLNGTILAQAASQNFEQEWSRQEQQTEQLKR